MKMHKATSRQRVLTECGLWIDHVEVKPRGVLRAEALPNRTRWSGVKCLNCLRSHPDPKKRPKR